MPTRTSSGVRRPPLDHARARTCLVANLVTLPGIGSILAGRRAGWVQAAIAATGFALSSYWATTFVIAWVKAREFPFDGGPHLREGIVGVALFVAAWLWALASGLRLLREARTQQQRRDVE